MEFTFDVPSRDGPQADAPEAAQLSQSDFLLKLVATSSAPERDDALDETLASIEGGRTAGFFWFPLLFQNIERGTRA